MTVCRIGYTRVKVHPGLFLVLAGAVILGLLGELLQAFLALTMHEAFHAIATHALGYRIESIELLPFGGVAHVERGMAVSPRAELIIAMAGPLCNFVVAGGIALAIHKEPALANALSYFLTMNIALGVFNLLPALPLDGGRMLRAVLAHILRPRTATLFCAWLGVFSALVLLGISVAMLVEEVLNPFFLIMGAFLLLAAFREMRALPDAQLRAILKRQDAFTRGEAVPARTMAVQAGRPAAEALRLLSASHYTVLLVLDENGTVIGQLDEGRLLNGLSRYGQNALLRQLL